MKKSEKSTQAKTLWIWGICVHILTFAFVLDLYFTSPINHGMTPHKTVGAAFAKRIVVFIADGLRAEAIYPQNNWNRVEYLSELRLNKSCSWGVVNTGVPTESRPGHVAIFAGLMEDPSAILTGWQANIVEFDSVINQSNYAWSFGSPDIVKIFTKKDKMKLTVDHYNPEQEDFSGRTSTIHLDSWVFNKVEELLTPKGNSCEALMIRKRRQRRRLHQLNEQLARERAKCQAQQDHCETGASHVECYERTRACRSALTSRRIEATVREAEVDLETLELLPCLRNFDRLECRDLCAQGNVFFLHLLGMDTAGHVHKPDSSEYLENLRAVDAGVRETEHLFREYFNDDETVFLFTADHGMTNWGSHGDGTEHETEVPYILWGKGVHAHKMRQDLRQTDLAPLIATLIGVPIPVNSMGILPHKLLDGSHQQVAEAVFANAMQHVEQYKLLLREFQYDSLFTEYPMFHAGYVDRTVATMRALLDGGDPEKLVVRMGDELMRETQLAIAYMAQYYVTPKVVTLMLGFVLWIVYLSLTVNVNENDGDDWGRDETGGWGLWRPIGVVLLMVTCFYLKEIQAKYFTYMYPVFLLSIITKFAEDRAVLSQLWIVFVGHNRMQFISRTLIYAVLVQLLVFGFFARAFCAIVIVILAFWLTQNKLPLNLKITWLCVTCTLALLQVIDPSTKFSYYGLLIGSLLWLVVYFRVIYKNGMEYIRRFDLKFKTTMRYIILTPLVGYCVAAANACYVAYAFDTEMGLSDLNLALSWLVTAAILFSLPTAPTGILSRFGHICGCLLVPYTLMAVNIDLIFYGILVVVLFYWMEAESKLHNSTGDNWSLEKLHFTVNYTKNSKMDVSALYRRTYFYLALTICYFFAIGNMASFNGFDPQWTRAYVATFNPFLMATLIVIKMVIPFFLITCGFYAIVLYTRTDETKVFAILLLFLEQMVLNFMLFVRNEGTWKEIGKSLSHFVVMEAMALVMLVFFGLARYVCSFRIGDSGTGYDDGGDNLPLREEPYVRKTNDFKSRIKKNWLYLRHSLSQTHIDTLNSLECESPSFCSKSNFQSPKPRGSLSRFPSPLLAYYASEKDVPNAETRPSTKKLLKSQEVQCGIEDEVKSLRTKVRRRRDDDVANVVKMFSGSTTDIFQVAFDLGIAATMEHYKTENICRRRKRSIYSMDKSKNTEDSNEVIDLEVRLPQNKGDSKVEITADSLNEHLLEKAESKEPPNVVESPIGIQHSLCTIPEEKSTTLIKLADRVDVNEEWRPRSLTVDRKPVYDLTYYKIFPTVDKMQAKEMRCLYNKPFYYQEGYLKIGDKFNKNEKGENIGMLSQPSYDDVDCHFYSARYSETRQEVTPQKIFKASFFLKRRYKSPLRRFRSVPHLEVYQKICLSKTPSETDISSRLDFETLQIEDAKKRDASGQHREHRLEKQLEKFNLSKAVYSEVNPGMKISSKISIIRTESYFDAREVQPAGSRVFRGSRTSFDSPDVLKLAPGLSREETIYYFMSDRQKAVLVEKLLASDRPKTQHEHFLINSYFNEMIRKAKDGLDPSGWFSESASSSISSADDKADTFEVLHKEALRNEKKRKREYRRKARELLAAAKQREEERLEQEKLAKARAEEALKKAEESKLAAFRDRKKSSIDLVPSQAVFNLGAKSKIKVLETSLEEVPLKLSLPKVEEAPKEVFKEDPKVGGAIQVCKEIAEKNPTFKELLTFFSNCSFGKQGDKVSKEDVSLPKPGNVPFRQPRQKPEQPGQKQSDSLTTADVGTPSKSQVKHTRRKFKTPSSTEDHKPQKSKSDASHSLDRSDSSICCGRVQSDSSPSTSATAAGRSATSKYELHRPVSRDKYDRNVCVRKRPSEQFLTNAMEMSMKLGHLPWSLSDLTLHVAKLPIRVAPGMLAEGKCSKCSTCERARSKYGLLQPPSEEAIKEERELDSSDVSSEPDTYRLSKAGSSRPPRRSTRTYTKSSPSLTRQHSEATYLADSLTSEERFLSSEHRDGHSSDRSDMSKTYSLPNLQLEQKDTFEVVCCVSKHNQSMQRLDNISKRYTSKTNLCVESMPQIMMEREQSESDESDDTSSSREAPTTTQVSKSSSIYFNSVTTSLKKDPDSDHRVPPTCYQWLNERATMVRPPNENDESEAVRTPRFGQNADPATYLVKVENWLNKVTPHQISQSASNVGIGTGRNTSVEADFDGSDNKVFSSPSESSINSDDLILNEQYFKDTCQKTDGPSLKVAEEREEKIKEERSFNVPSQHDQALISLEVAKHLMGEDQREHWPIQNVMQAYDIVKMVFEYARTLKEGQTSNALVNTEMSFDWQIHEAVTQTLAPTTFTTPTQISSTETCSAEVSTAAHKPLISAASQTKRSLSSKIHLKSKLVQVSSDMSEKEVMTDWYLVKTTSAVGVQHSFCEVGVNTKVALCVNRSTQYVTAMVDSQTFTDMPTKIYRDAGIDPICLPINIVNTAEVCLSTSITKPDDFDCSLGQSDSHEDFESSPTSPRDIPLEDVGRNGPVNTSTFGKTVSKLRMSFATRIPPRLGGRYLYTSGEPDIPDELCSASRVIERELFNPSVCQSGEFGRSTYEGVSLSLYKSPTLKLSRDSPVYLPPLSLIPKKPTSRKAAPLCLAEIGRTKAVDESPTLADISDMRKDSVRLQLGHRRSSTGISRISKKIPCRKRLTPSSPQAAELMNKFARIDIASKSYRPALKAIAEIKARNAPKPKFKSVPRTDYALLPDEHPETEILLRTLMHASTTASSTSTTMAQACSSIPLHSSLRSVSPRKSPSSQVSGTNASLTFEQLTEVIQRCKNIGMSEVQICRELERERVKRRSCN